MPQDFRQTLTALNAERPFASWAAMALGAAGLGLWVLWAVATPLPQDIPAVQVRREAGQLVARFQPSPATVPLTVLISTTTARHVTDVQSATWEAGAMVLRVAMEDDASAPLPQVSLPMPPRTPAQLILASLGFGK